MCCKRCARYFIYQLLSITMICTQEHLPVYFFQRFYSPSHTGVHRFYRFNGCCLHTSMSYHIRISKIDNNHIVFQ